MAGGYTVGIASETKAFKQGIESGIIDPLEDAQKELLELGRARGPEQLEKGMKDAERATERLGDETKRTARQIEQEFRDTYRKVKQSSDDGMDGAKEGLDDFKQESRQTARESAASFDGSAESIVDAFQEVAANAFGGFGLAGEVAGLAAALGIGAAVAGFAAVDEAQKQSEQRAHEWAEGFIEAGTRVIGSAYQVAAVQAIAVDPEKYKQAETNAKNWGVTTETAMLAMAGNAAALTVAQQSVADEQDRLNEKAEAALSGGEKLTAQEQARTIELLAGASALAQQRGEMEKGAQIAGDVSDALLRIVESSDSAVVEVDELNNKLITLPDDTQVLVNAETGQASLNVSDFKGDVDGIPDTVTTTAQLVASLSGAQREIDGFITRNSGRTIQFKGRVISADGWDG